MLWVYAGLNLIECDHLARDRLPSGYIDLSKTRASELSDTLVTVYSHHPGSSIYLGFIDPLQMITQPHEAACRKVFRDCQVALITSNPLLLPYSWKNGTAKLVVVGKTKQEDARNSQVIHDSGSPLLQHEVGHGQSSEEHTP